jgi:rare lipoprotein A
LRRLPAVLAALLALGGCNLLAQRHAPAPSVHYVVGQPYQADGMWHYPRERFDLDETGLAVATTRKSGLTADGEVADPTALAAAHPSLQLPALARVTNLDTGLQTVVRVNDRGPAQRGRALALTPRAIALLGGPAGGVLRVRLQVLEAESRQLAGAARGAEAPPLPVTAAPAGVVKSETLAPPPGVQQSAAAPLLATPQPKQSAPMPAAAAIPLRLPEKLFQVPPHPGALYVELGTFGRLEYAELMRRRMAFLGAQTSTSYDAPRDRAYRVRIGPLPDVASADAALTRSLQAGVAEGHIIVD